MDKGYYESIETLCSLERTIDVVSIAMNGKCTTVESERDHDPLFRHAQVFRAGIEGAISFLKRMLCRVRCFNKRWKQFVATVEQIIFAHNLLALSSY